ncbi:MAG TPA: hypothetical protein VN247_00280, partial [Arenimonas sp.]|nr:hypothetical protein [Arenimonas sp.]
MNVASKRTFPFYLHISTLVILLVLTVGASVTYISYSRTTQILEIASRDLFKHTAREAESEFEQLFAPGEMATNLLALQSVTRATNLDQRLDSLAFLKTALDSSPEISYFFTGYGNGDAFIMRRLTGNSDRKLMAAPSNAYYMVQSIERQNSVIRGDHIYYDKDLIKIGSEELQEHQKIFDARTL